MQIAIDFEQTYPPTFIAEDLTEMRFNALQRDGSIQQILVKISKHPDPLLPDVYNLGFGPPASNGGFKDNVSLHHSNINKVFSTVLFLALAFLDSNNGFTIGIDGSNDLRARLYHRMFKHNRAYFNEFFLAIGVDWYVRIFRNGQYEAHEDGTPYAKPRPELFDYERENRDLYRYYMFKLK
ncbi:DUF6934 family protein [Pedobacter endophyticus]|uniref:Uncharacterized protein n=1 Tax=Pedobacter endophyticus TaxID=2789740 RepID=A0A7U3SQI8_9SPHI|nr:hypothetical protein [Pedobacter endophyticus]QPH38411.1 hypothetical protein IZT61_15140 [Pedobacter endophyticus]